MKYRRMINLFGTEDTTSIPMPTFWFYVNY